MPLRGYKPTSAGRRFMTRPTFEEITTTEAYKPLLEPQKRISGRNAQGRMTVRLAEQARGQRGRSCHE